MKIVWHPRNDRAVLATSLVLLPMILLNIWVASRGSFSVFTQPLTVQLMLAAVMVVLLLCVFLFRKHWFGFYAYLTSCSLIILTNSILLFKTHNYALGFLITFQLLVFAWQAVRFISIFSEAYFTSGRRWFEGAARSFPSVALESTGEGDGVVKGKISALSEKGFFVNFETKASLDKIKDVTLKSATRSQKCAVKLCSSDLDHGAGYFFTDNSVDQKKEIADFVDDLRSSGYVP